MDRLTKHFMYKHISMRMGSPAGCMYVMGVMGVSSVRYRVEWERCVVWDSFSRLRVVGRLGFEWCRSTSNTIGNVHFYQLHAIEVSRLGFQYRRAMDLHTIDMD